MNDRELLEVLERTGGIERLRRANANLKALSAAAPTLLPEHGGEWVAVHNCKVVGTDASVEALRARLRDHGIDPEEASIHYLVPSDETIIV